MTKPNILLLTVGCSNSSIVMRMLEQLGWNLGDADDKYAESVSCRAVNMRRPFVVGDAVDALAALPQPWAIKDPRFCETLPAWKPLLIRYKPFLLWVTKDLAYVKASLVRRFGARPAWADERMHRCQTHYATWPYGRLKIDVGQIAAAVRLFDPARAFAHAVSDIAAD